MNDTPLDRIIKKTEKALTVSQEIEPLKNKIFGLTVRK